MTAGVGDDVDRVVLTFAELAFLLTVRPAPEVRAQLLTGYPEGAETAGESSLLARELCEVRDGKVVPGHEVVIVLAGLTTPTARFRAAAWTSDGMRFVHLFSGPELDLAVFPFEGLRFDARVLASPACGQLAGFVDAHLPPEGPGTVLLDATTGRGVTSMSITVDEAGAVTVSDTERSPDRGLPVTRSEALERVAELFEGVS